MKMLLLAFIFFAGVYCGLNTNPEGEINRALEQIRDLITGEADW